MGDLRRPVKTTWKYSTGSRSSARAAIQSLAAGPWHFGQCRFLQEFPGRLR
jgi:hypothetical protein